MVSLKSTLKVDDPIRLGVVGLGRGFSLSAPSLLEDPHVSVVAASAPRQESRDSFQKQFGGQAYARYEDLLADNQVEAIHVVTPHGLHAEMIEQAAAAKKHLLVDKPLSIQLEDGLRAIKACKKHQSTLLVGPCHSFDRQILDVSDWIRSGEFGPVLAVQAMNYTDFMYRPRRPEEFDTSAGGGVLFSQGAHQIDIVRLLCGGMVSQVFAVTGHWDPSRQGEHSYQAILKFESGATAQCTYSGFAHFDSDEWQDWVGETGFQKDPDQYAKARKLLSESTDAEITLKRGRTFGANDLSPIPPFNEHFGPLLVQCQKADLRVTAQGVHVYADVDRSFREVPVKISARAPVFEALYSAIRRGTSPVQTGDWSLATLEICHLIIESARLGEAVRPKLQVPTPSL